MIYGILQIVTDFERVIEMNLPLFVPTITTNKARAAPTVTIIIIETATATTVIRLVQDAILKFSTDFFYPIV